MRVGAAPSSAPRCGMLLALRSARLRIVVLGTSCELARGAPRPARSRRPRHGPAQAGVPIRGVLRFELQEDFGGTRSGGERGYQVRLPLESEQAHPMPLSQLPKLSRSKPFKVVFHSSALRL